MYTVPGYNSMLADRIRMEAYASALRRAVRLDSIVVDIGAGTGGMTLLACQFGARRVFAIEPDDVIQVAREIVRANGYADRVEFFQQPSAAASLPERVDVAVSDLRGVLPLWQSHLPTIVDARQRFLKPGGALIPQSDTLWAAVAEVPDVYSNQVDFRFSGELPFDMEPARRRACNHMLKAPVSSGQLLADPQCWATLDYTRLESADVSGELCWTAKRDGLAHGVVLWFDAVLAPGIGFSNSPMAPELIYGKMLLPFEQAVPLAAGDRITLSLRADLVQRDYVWRWNTCVTEGASSHRKAEFAQSTFQGAPLSPAQLRKQSADHVPVPNPEAEVDYLVLTEFRAGTPLKQIARLLGKQFPERFGSEAVALTHVAELSLKYSR